MTTANPSISEDDVRDFLANRVDTLEALFVDLEAKRSWVNGLDDAFLNGTAENGGPSATEILNYVASKKVLRALDRLYDLTLIGKEYELLATGKPGYQPRADIFACNREMGSKRPAKAF
jgi:hypothetical protein